MTPKTQHTERFAPSPTGLLHLGHLYSALLAYEKAKANNGRFLLRIEDIDTARCKPEFEAAIFEDLAWMGLTWETPVVRQSERGAAYGKALETLMETGLCYPCGCTRKDIQSALTAPQEGANIGPDGVVYPGTCRKREVASRSKNDAIRLNMGKAIAHLGGAPAVNALSYLEKAQPIQLNAQALIDHTGDIVLARKDLGTSYHLSVVVDDAEQQVTHVTRGEDMRAATPIHRLLQALLGLPALAYHHHPLIRDENGKRLAKRHDALAIRALKEQGKTAAALQAEVFAKVNAEDR